MPVIINWPAKVAVPSMQQDAHTRVCDNCNLDSDLLKHQISLKHLKVTSSKILPCI